jgi:hypothetical protein
MQRGRAMIQALKHSSLAFLTLIFSSAAHAETSLSISPSASETSPASEGESPSPAEQSPAYADQPSSSGSSRWTRYVMIRGDLADPRLDKKLSAPAIASQSLLLDLNLTGKTEFSDLLRFQADVDLHARRFWNYKKRNLVSGSIETTQDIGEENPEYRLALNELYVNGDALDGIQYTAGKKRILWGTGFAANPTDLLNPAKNPLDPTYERRGAWLVQVERIQEQSTVAFFMAPGVIENKHTLPKEAGIYKDAEGKRSAHYLLGWRYYMLLGGADINLMLFNSERYQDDMSHAWKTGASWSQIATALSKQLETHAEILVQRGSVRPTAAGVERLGSRDLFFKALVGMRYDLENESALLVEYVHNSEGDSTADLQRRLQNLRDLTVKFPSLAQKSTLPLLMRNTLYVNYQRYKFNDDTFVSWAVAHNLHDHSGFQGPVLQWTPTQTTSLTVSASVDYNLVKNSGAAVTGIGRVRTNELNPAKSRAGLEVKSYF